MGVAGAPGMVYVSEYDCSQSPCLNDTVRVPITSYGMEYSAVPPNVTIQLMSSLGSSGVPLLLGDRVTSSLGSLGVPLSETITTRSPTSPLLMVNVGSEPVGAVRVGLPEVFILCDAEATIAERSPELFAA